MKVENVVNLLYEVQLAKIASITSLFCSFKKNVYIENKYVTYVHTLKVIKKIDQLLMTLYNLPPALCPKKSSNGKASFIA